MLPFVLNSRCLIYIQVYESQTNVKTVKPGDLMDYCFKHKKQLLSIILFHSQYSSQTLVQNTVPVDIA